MKEMRAYDYWEKEGVTEDRLKMIATGKQNSKEEEEEQRKWLLARKT